MRCSVVAGNPSDALIICFFSLQGEWKPKQIDNPNYKGVWVHPEIDNPEYSADSEIYKFAKVGVIGLDLWQVRSSAKDDWK